MTTPTLIPQDARCIGCGYLLHGLAEHRCPECGRAFEPSEPLSMKTARWRQRVRLAYWLPGILFLTTWISLVVAPNFLPYSLVRWTNLLGERLQLTAWFLISLIVAWKLRTRARKAILWPVDEPHPTVEKVARRILVVVGLIIFFFGSGGVSGRSCPHGESFRVGPICVTHSTVGGPCNNFAYHVRRWRVGQEWYVSLIRD